MAKILQPEHGLSHWVKWWLDQAFIGPGWYTAQETGVSKKGMNDQQFMRVMQARAARGIKPHALDWLLYQRPEMVHFELKVKDKVGTDNQEITRKLLEAQGIPTAVCRTVPEIHRFLAANNIRLHGNSAGIAALAHERYLAGRREDAVKVAKPKTASKPRAGKPTQSRIKALERIRRGVLF